MSKTEIRTRHILYILTLIAIVAASVFFGFFAGKARGASTAGSSEDPLITEEYLLEVFEPKIDAEVEARVAAALAEVDKKIDDKIAGAGISDSIANGTYSMPIISMYIGQALKLSPGAEIILTKGTLNVASGDIIDTTAAQNAQPAANITVLHMYVAGAEGANVTVLTETAEVLVRGDYTLVG